jgi:hypothetical protein
MNARRGVEDVLSTTREINNAEDGGTLMPRRKRESYEEHRERVNVYERERQRQKRMADPEYRKRYNAYQREWQRKRKGLPPLDRDQGTNPESG